MARDQPPPPLLFFFFSPHHWQSTSQATPFSMSGTAVFVCCPCPSMVSRVASALFVCVWMLWCMVVCAGICA